MAILPILKYPDPRLATIAKEVEVVDSGIQQLVADMLETMYAANGIGLAATQVDRHIRLVVMDLSETRDQARVFINPTVKPLVTDRQKGQEGCLSVPGIFDEVERYTQVQIHALDVGGQAFELTADGLLAVCIQHELDHLNGTVFVQHLSRLKQDRIRTKLRKQSRE